MAKKRKIEKKTQKKLKANWGKRKKQPEKK